MSMLLLMKGGLGSFPVLLMKIQMGFEGGFWANSQALLLLLLLLIAGLVFLGFRMRSYFRSQTEKGLAGSLSDEGSPYANRTKYEKVDAFKLSGTFFNLGLVVAIALAVMAFGWSNLEDKIVIPEGALELEDDIIMEEPPRTAEPPPPPPPPPPEKEEDNIKHVQQKPHNTGNS